MIRLVFLNLLLAVACAMAAALSLYFSYQVDLVTFIWPPAGFAFAAVMLGGLRFTPGLFLGISTASILAGAAPITTLFVGIGFVVEPIVARAILKRVDFNPRLRRQRDAIALLLVAVLGTTVISAWVGALGLALGNTISWEGFFRVFRVWWLSNIAGVLILAPMFLTWWRDPLQWPSRRTLTEIALFYPGLILLSLVFFAGITRLDLEQYPLGSIMVPVVLLASIRFGARGATVAVNLVAMVVVVGASMAEGPFTGPTNLADIFGVWIYLFVLGLTTLGAVTLRAEQEMATKALQKNEEKYRSLVENINDVIFHLDTEGTFTYVSPVMERISQFRREDVEGTSFLEFVHPDDLMGLMESLQRTMAGETAPHIFRVFDKDGSCLTVKTSSRLLYEQGEVVGVSGIMTNVTGEVLMQEALRESEERLQMALTGAELAMWDWNIAKKSIMFSEAWARMTGYPMDDMEVDVALWRDRIHPADLDFVVAQMKRHVDGETRFYEAEHRIIRQDGTNGWYLTRGRIFAWDNNGNPTRAVGTCLDVTKRKHAEEERIQLEAQIQHAQKLESLGVLAGGIAHDFNNLLVGILGNADLGLLEMPQSTPGRSYFHNIVVSAQRAADLCKQMLAYSGKGRFIIEGINLNSLIDEMLYLLEVSISKNAILKCRLAQNLPSIEGDPTQIRQVLMNLITNASEALEEKSGVITISTDLLHCDRAYLSRIFLNEPLAEGLYICLEVSDTGCGMDAVTQARLFEPFFTTKFTGRGLGMAAVIGIVRGHNGAIKVYSEVGRGTTFKVLLPAAACALPEATSQETQSIDWRGAGTILVVDDEPGVRAICQITFERFGFTVLTAPDGRKGLDIFQEHHEDITAVLLDMSMPNMNGEETYREMRKIDPGVRVVLTSGYNEQEATGRFAGKGLAGFIQKPFRTENLVECFRTALGSMPEPRDDAQQ